MRQAGFTLIEMLVVISIISLAMGMILVSQGRWSKDAAVMAQAERFAGVCKLARSRAMLDNTPYAIAINIQNQPGSSGRVINNRSGGHWYRMVGPQGHTNTQGSVGKGLLIAYPGSYDLAYRGSGSGYRVFPEVVEALKETWIGPQYQLPAGKVRFLALSDTEEGARTPGENNWHSYGYTSTYPRPWFGYFDPARKRLFPWGGYDPQLSIAEPWCYIQGGPWPVTNYTGFFYQGSDPPVIGCRNPVDRSFNVDWNHDNDFSDSDPARGPELGHKVFTAGEPRPLVSGDWQDFLIVFCPDGTAYIPPLKTNRKRFANQQYVIGGTTNAEFYANGVADTALPWVGTAGAYNGPLTASYDFGQHGMAEQSEIAHFQRNTGAYRITLASDSRDDQDAFPDARAAMASLGVVYRVEISVQGSVRVMRVAMRGDEALAGLPLFPSTPAYWAGTPGTYADFMHKNIRWGFLHQPKTRSGDDWSTQGIADAIPRGHPIVDFVTPRMMTDKIWWIDD